MSTERDHIPRNEPAPECPWGIHRVFLGIGAGGFLILAACLVTYGVYGERITAGLDRACAEAALDAARKLEAAGNVNGAIQKYRQAWDGHIGDREERFRCGLAIGDLLYRDGRYNEALAAYAELPEEAFATAGSYAGFVGALWASGQSERAERLAHPWLDRAMAEKNVEQEVWARKILMRQAESRGALDEAMTHARRIREVDPGGSGALALAGLQRSQGDIAGARATLEAFLEVSENPARRQSARSMLDQLAPGAPAGQ